MATRKARKSTELLNIYLNGTHIGKLERETTGAISFSYASSWIESEHAFPISRQLPLQENSFSGKIIRDYFDNLLPDDRRIREKLAAQSQAKGIQPFDLLSALGKDCVGALQFYPEGMEPGEIAPAKGKVISDSKIAETLRNLQIKPLGIDRDSDFRISLAGVQNKTALLWNKNKWMIPLGPTPTTHILKPAIGKHQGGPDFSLSVENEWLCLKILRAYGLHVADAEIIDFEDIRVLSVKRFDREWVKTKLYRIPQEDLCQAFGVGPENKYESDGGPGIVAILNLLNESDRRDEDRKNFIKTQIIFWLIAAIDGHAKNFSIFNKAKGFSLTPIYDVMSADPHVNPKTLPFEKIKLAMAVGDSRHYKIKEILPRHWRQTAAKGKFAEIDELIEEVRTQTESVVKTVNSNLPRHFPKKISEPIFKTMIKRSKTLK